MIKKVTLDRNQKPTEEQIKQINEAAKKEIHFDEDSPELTPAMEKAFKLAAKNRNTQRKTAI
ncbi:MAG: hypothetical protein U0L23_01915 [Lachnospiraceae bacterium]|nr:hypothetical protein [Lachnospiraceae bacterium]MEE1341449.1 hypothetical protein [Lachnospiraceae bacterium]